ncbi:Mur ligase domain-containing protein, partial [Candidatus Symbiothrix dinenymphae]|uniref:Mur ligase domain-containing protein n=1 Tax=Candidatus Symbiothrix dinenymphae TaxID=467085 RepID=UPI001D038682
MKSLNDIQTMYFIGAGGIGMSNLVRYFLAEGKTVGGYDRVESALTRELNAGGAQIHYWDDVNMIPEAFKNPKTTLAVWTPAIPAEHSELGYFRTKGFEVMKRAQGLGEITKTKRGIC